MLKSTLISSLVGVLVFFSVSAHHTPNPPSNNQEKNFVVIGAFGFHNNAVRFIEYAHAININAEYALNKERNLYYVYSLVSENKEEAINSVLKLRQSENFKDAWLFHGLLSEDQGKAVLLTASNKVSSENLTYAENNDNTQEVSYENSRTVPSANISDEEDNMALEKIESTSTKQVISQSTKNPLTSDEGIKGNTKTEKLTSEVSPSIITEDYKLYINAVNSKKFKEVKGTIEIRDHQRDKKLKTVNSHELFGINDPKNGNHTVRLVSRVFGYRPMEYVIDLSQPKNNSTSSYVDMIGDSIIVNFDLERLRKGEIAVMWNVLFFKDAAIMRPESKDELNSLLTMLKENDNLKVKIHGHTNGNSHGKLLHLNLEDKDFFSLSGNHIQDTGSAKKLSEYRGYTIQHYLMEQGINESRLEIKGWGGKKMIHDKHDAQARNNVRVEIEIMDL